MLIDPKTGRPFASKRAQAPVRTPPPAAEAMTKEILEDLGRRRGQLFPAFGYMFRVTITGPAGMAAEFVGPTGKKKKGKVKR